MAIATKDVKAAPKMFDISDENVDKGLKLVIENGSFTQKDFPEMKDDDWAKALFTKIDTKMRTKNEDHYLYCETFDFAQGKIGTIIFDMDQIETRSQARQLLGETLGYQIN